jgi:hypothetical protein
MRYQKDIVERLCLGLAGISQELSTAFHNEFSAPRHALSEFSHQVNAHYGNLINDKPKVVTLGVYADCPVKEGWQYLNARQLIFIADNENIDCGRGDYSPRLSGDLVEEIRYVVPIEAAKKIATAKTLEGRIGGREFTLTHAQRRLFRLFIATFPGFEALKNEPLQARE